MKFEVNPCSIALDENFTCLLTDSMSPSPLYQGATQSSRDLSDPMAVAVAVEGSASKVTKSWRLRARSRCSLDLSLSHSRLERGVEAVEDAKFGLEKISQAGQPSLDWLREKVRAQADVQYGWQGLYISAELLHLPDRTGAILLLS